MGSAEVLNLNLGVAVLIDDLEGPRLHVLLDGGVIEAATDQTPVQSCEGILSAFYAFLKLLRDAQFVLLGYADLRGR